MRSEHLWQMTVLLITFTMYVTTFKPSITTLHSLSHQQCRKLSISQHSSNDRGQSALHKEEKNLTDWHSCHEWSSDHLQSHQLDVLSYPKSLLSYHSYTLGILMMALLFAVISGNSMTYLPGS